MILRHSAKKIFYVSCYENSSLCFRNFETYAKIQIPIFLNQEGLLSQVWGLTKKLRGGGPVGVVF